ncbi:MAG: hypothetical protein KDD38_01975 [Bdellovibrionales bacterium]|nr:hypothetical protein [Bdellovibrionales bacterium]
MQNLRVLLLVGLVCITSSANARVFSFKDSWVSAYFRGTGGVSKVADNAYEHTSGSDTQFEDDVDYNFSGEIGFAFLLGESLSFRAGVEGLQTKSIIATGTNGATTDYMDVDSKSVAFNPNVSLEFGFLNTGTSRAYVFAGAGYANVKVTNAYSLTTAGAAYYTAPATFKETWAATVLNYNVGAGYEMFILDNVTFSIDGGWRFFKASGFEYDSATTAIRGAGAGAVASGATVTDNLGNKPELDLGGAYVGIMFKFYIPPLN